MSDYRLLASEAEKKYKLPQGLLGSVITAESNWNPKARSPAGALGIAQFMPATAKEMGIDPLDPVQAIDGAARYFAQNLKRFNGNKDLAIAAYNAGPGAVQKYGGIPPYKETQGYVKKVNSGMKPQSTYTFIDDDKPASTYTFLDDEPKQANGASASWGETRQDRAQKNRKDLAALGKGALSGVADIGDTILNAAAKVIPPMADWNRERNAGLESFNSENESNPNFKAGRIASNVLSTLPVAGVLAKGAAKVPLLKSLAPSIKSGGMMGGNLSQRMAGGAIAGTAAAGLVDPEHALTGGVIGAAIPGVGAVGKYAGNTANSLIQPLTSKGQDQIVNRVVEKFAKGGPTQINAAELVPGSTPTLSQATGNAGLARLENLLRDTNPNAFQEVAERNAAARANAFSDIAGDPSSIAALQAQRTQASIPLLNSALKNSRAADATAPILIDKILSGPRGGRTAVKSTLEQVRSKMFNPDGTPITDAATLYHSARKEITDLLDKRAALSNPGAQQATRELMAIKRALDRDINRAAPGFKDYLTKYAEGSKPIDAQQFLQSVNIADANGIIQLGKVQTAIRSIEKLKKARGANQAKSIAPDQMDVLYKIRDDLLRANKQHLGRSAGSNTRQNFALENILDNALPGPLRALQNPLGRLGKVSKVVYGSADEEIRNRLVDLLLNPANSRLVNNGQLGLLGQGTPKPLMRGLLPHNALPVGGAGLLEEPY